MQAKSKKGNKGTTGDLDSLLAEFQQKDQQKGDGANPVPPPQAKLNAKSKAKAKPKKAHERHQDEDDSEDDDDSPPVQSKSKPKGKGGKEVSAMGKLIAERRERERQEEDRIRKVKEDNDRILKEEEDRRLAEEKRIEDERMRKVAERREMKRKLIEEGKYRTPAEIKRDNKNKEIVEQLKASGQYQVVAPSSSTSTSSGKVNYGRRTHKPGHHAAVDTDQIEVSGDVVVDSGGADDDWDDDNWVVPTIEANTKTAIDDDDDDYDDPLLEAEIDLALQEKAEADRQFQQAALDWSVMMAERKTKEDAVIATANAAKASADMELEIRRMDARRARLDREDDALKRRDANNLRCPVSVVMGHVDTGKTSLLDKIRNTNVQKGEAGGITQQIGSTCFPKQMLTDMIAPVLSSSSLAFELILPGLIVIDTPGHESFANLRNRGSSLCDIAILVVDLMHGLEPQTLESLSLLRQKRVPFIIALNKIDRCYDWRSIENASIATTLSQQPEHTRSEFESRAYDIRADLMKQSINSELYWKNDDLQHTVSLVPTSAVTGEGVCDLIFMMSRLCQSYLVPRLMKCDNLQCTILEVKTVDGLGTVMDVLLVNGRLNEGDRVVLSTLEGPIVTSIRALLTPPPSREIRVKAEYTAHGSIEATVGVRVVCSNLDKVVAGSPVFVPVNDFECEDMVDEQRRDLESVTKLLTNMEQNGVLVHASTLGSLEALMQYLRHDCNPIVPVSGVGIGPIYKKDIIRASIMLEKGCVEFAVILAFDVDIDAEAAAMAAELGVRIFTADIIYHLFGQFSDYLKEKLDEKRRLAMGKAIFPVIFRIMPDNIFNRSDPIIMGVEVTHGRLKVGTPLTIPERDVDLGRVESIENNHKQVQEAKAGDAVAVRIGPMSAGRGTPEFGRQFDAALAVYSKLTRESIDALKEYYKDELTLEEWKSVKRIATVLKIEKPKKKPVETKEDDNDNDAK